MKTNGHIITIDAARGFFAIAVMAYHLLFFNEIMQVERVAYYAVYGFFVISGFALVVAYQDGLNEFGDARSYFIRRFFRIAPLYFAVLAFRLVMSPWPSEMFYRLLLNFTLTFGIANPGATSLVGGGWSIGIEMVFYVIFPIVLAITNRSLLRFAAVTIFAIAVGIMFANIILRGHSSMVEPLVWERYTQPVAFFGYFSFGMLLAAVYLKYPSIKGHRISLALIALGLAPFLFIRTTTTLALLMNWQGIALMTGTLLIVTGAALLPEPRGLLRRASIWMGTLSYTVYLLHPLVHGIVRKVVPMGWLNIAVVTSITVALSVLVNRTIEVPGREWGRRLAARNCGGAKSPLSDTAAA